jgi:dihydrofolate synthase / folylpolyglutamate synthase
VHFAGHKTSSTLASSSEHSRLQSRCHPHDIDIVLMSSHLSALEYLYGLQRFGVKLGLRNIRIILRALDNPERKFPSIHIAGTNGKGSTSAMIAAVLSSAGYRVGLYSSPYLVKFNERIRIDGAMITDADLVRYTRMIRPSVDACRATFFETTTAITFRYFADRKVDVAVIETGLGGTFDATNVLKPIVSVITSISKDHTELLGGTIARIAAEKGGIIKRKIPIVFGGKAPAAERVLSSIASAKRSPYTNARRVVDVLDGDSADGGQTVSLQTEHQRYPDLFLPLPGGHQRENLATAVAAIEILQQKDFPTSERELRRGLAGLVRFSGLQGRAQWLSAKPMVLLDVAHNPDAIARLVSYVRSLEYDRLHLVFGVMRDKDFRSMVQTLSKLKPLVVAVAPAIPRALEPDVLARSFHERGIVTRQGKDVAQGIAMALKTQKRKDLLLITGSHYVAGEAMEYWRRTRRGRIEEGAN